MKNDFDNNTPIMVSFQNISKSYKAVQALVDVSFNLHKGEIMGYIGPNGAGKTTSMKILVGLIRDFQGKVLINGVDPLKSPAIAHQMGYMPQDTGFQEWRTANHALSTFGMLSGMNSEQLKSRIPEILNIVGLGDVANRKIVNYSGGMQQKLKLAQTILHNPELVILDEPMNGLDPASRFQMKQIIKRLADEGKTVLFSSHILSDVQDIADRIAIVANGRLIKIGTPQELQDAFLIGDDVEIIYSPDSKPCRALESVPGVKNVEKVGSRRYIIHLDVSNDPDAIMQKIYAIIVQHQCQIRNINLLRPSLEDVYLKYVGGVNR
jgi:ABC-2 type transport system ATP-binding protein